MEIEPPQVIYKAMSTETIPTSTDGSLSAATATLHPDLTAAVHALRGALTEMFAEVGADLTRPQDLSRKLSLDKSLAWKLSRIASASEAHEALQHLPGEAAIQIVLRAVERAGGSPHLAHNTTQITQALLEAVRTRIGDKSTLELVVDALPDQTGQRLTASRKLAFRGNSAIWGVQARVRLNTVLLHPNAHNPEMIDVGLIGAWVDFRRLRHDAKWTMFRRNTFSGESIVPDVLPIDPFESAGPAMLMRDFCSPVMPEIETHIESGVIYNDLGHSEVGNSGIFTCVFGTITRALGSRFSDDADSRASFPAGISAPAESLQFDMFIHRDCAFALKQDVRTIAKLTVHDGQARDTEILPIQIARRDLGREPPSFQSPLVPKYAQMITHATSVLGWNLNEFIGTRYLVDYPPFPCSVVVSCPLEKR